jgi:hypothetical protein
MKRLEAVDVTSAEFDEAHSRMQQLLETLPEDLDEASPAYKYAEAVTFKHHASHAAQIEEWKKQISS